jgi:hypothetical protein
VLCVVIMFTTLEEHVLRVVITSILLQFTEARKAAVAESVRLTDSWSMRILEFEEHVLRVVITSILLQFTEARKAAVAESVGLTSKDVDDMLTQYTVAKQTFDRLAQLKRDGKPMPKTIEEVSKSGFVITSCLVLPGVMFAEVSMVRSKQASEVRLESNAREGFVALLAP